MQKKRANSVFQIPALAEWVKDHETDPSGKGYETAILERVVEYMQLMQRKGVQDTDVMQYQAESAVLREEQGKQSSEKWMLRMALRSQARKEWRTTKSAIVESTTGTQARQFNADTGEWEGHYLVSLDDPAQQYEDKETAEEQAALVTRTWEEMGRKGRPIVHGAGLTWQEAVSQEYPGKDAPPEELLRHKAIQQRVYGLRKKLLEQRGR